MIAIHVALYRDAFHGLRDTGEPDWPPSPRRVLGALIAGAHSLTKEDPLRARALEAIHRIASAAQPVIDAPDHRPLGLPPTYAPKTWLPDEKAPGGISKFLDLSQVHMDSVARALKPQDGVVLAGPDIRFYVDIDCDEGELAALDAAARRIPYFGTSKDPADISVTTARPPSPPPPSVIRWYPHHGGRSHGWQPNTVDWFERNFQRIFGHDPAVAQLPPIPPTGFVQPLSYDSRRPATQVQVPAAQLVRAVPNNQIPALIAQLHGRLLNALPGWRLFPLTISHEEDNPRTNGDGRCVGFGIKPPEQSLPSEAVAEASDVLSQSVALLSSSGQGHAVSASMALRIETWTGPAETWYSVTPLRAFPDERVVRYELAKELKEQSDAELISLHLQRSPRIRRNGRWSNLGLTDGLDQWWAEFTLSKPIDGPLLLGAATEHGFGTFRPKEKR